MFRKVRFYFAFARIYIKRDKRKVTIVFVAILLIIFLLRILVPAVTPKFLNAYAEYKKPTFVEGAVGIPVHPNPLFDETQTQKDISRLIFRSLLKVDSKGNLVPDLAKSFEQKDGIEYTFYLKENVFWHDGEKFDADDVVYTVKLAQDPNVESKLGDNFRDVIIEKIDKFTVKFILKESFSPFPFALTDGIIAEHITLKNYKPIGTGTFAVKEINKIEITLTNSDLNLVFRFFPSFADAKTALKLGEIHGLGGYTPQETEQIKKFGGRNVYSKVLGFRQAVVFFNLSTDHTKDKNVRQALVQAIDKVSLRDSVAGSESKLAFNQLFLGNWVVNSKERYPVNTDITKKLLQKAGYKLDKGTWAKKGEELKLTITVADDSELNSIANILKLSWEEIGIGVIVDSVENDTLIEKHIPNRNFQVLINFQEISPDPDQYVLWHTTQVRKSNITGIRSAKLDKLLEDTRKIEERDKRKLNYELFTKLLLDETPAIFLYYPQYIWVVSDKVSGIDLQDFTFPADRFDSYKKWVIKNGYRFFAF